VKRKIRRKEKQLFILLIYETIVTAEHK